MKVRGSLHSHGCWTDYRNRHEKLKFPFDLEKFARLCINSGRDFQAISDIMAREKGKPAFAERRYAALIDTAHPKGDYEFEYGAKESKVTFPDGQFWILRTQEVLTGTSLQHILAIDCERDIEGGMDRNETLIAINEAGGYAIVNHGLMGDCWDVEDLERAYEDGTIEAGELNGGLAVPDWVKPIISKFPVINGMKDKLPTRDCNTRLNGARLPLIANDDSRSAEDIRRGATTSYRVRDDPQQALTDRIVDSIKERSYVVNMSYSHWASPFIHILDGTVSQLCFGDRGLPGA